MDDDRGALPYALIHGEALVVCAAWALGAAGVTPIDATVDWEVLVESEEPVVLHDALCPITPPVFIADLVRDCLATGEVLLGVRPVTDTVKVVSGGLAGETVDRDGLLAVASPLVIPPAVVAQMDRWPGSDLGAAAATLAAAGHRVRTVTAPSEGRRVDSVEGVLLLEALGAGVPSSG
ncbi:MAG: 2-C-methyl-D-erythritol 4-phosphate cytidylyltransferase [Nocardioides sp.]|nr:2-C-methyl-D-erythritol 4-phosphate cytidylyltransferase [Nocardioides sp.]